MKLSKSQLKRIIQEELQKVLMREQSLGPSPYDEEQHPDPIYKRMDRPDFRPDMLPRGMRLHSGAPKIQYIEDAYTRKNPQIQAVKRMIDQISSCAPMGVAYGGEHMEIGIGMHPSRHHDRDWGPGQSDPRSIGKHGPERIAGHEYYFNAILQGVKVENFPKAIEAATVMQEGLPTECQQLGANLLQLLGSFVAKGGGQSFATGANFKPKESEVPTDPRHSR